MMLDQRYERDSVPPILSFVKKNAGSSDTEQDVLWPARVQNITAYKRGEQTLNIFEQSVLRLAEKGCRDARDVSDLLCLDHDLISFIQKKLQSLGYLDTHNDVTKRATEEITKLLTVGENMVPVALLIVTERVGGHTFPVLLPRRDFIEPMSVTDYKVKFNLSSSIGKNDEVDASWIRAVTLVKVQEMHEEFIANIAREHLRQYERISFSTADAIQPQQMGDNANVSLAGSTDVLLHCRAVLQKGSTDVCIMDPFGFGYSKTLSKQLDKLRAINESAQRLVTDVRVKAQVNLRTVKKATRKEKRMRFQQYGEIRKHYMDFCRALESATNTIVTNDAEMDQREKALRELATSAYACVEWALWQVAHDNLQEEWFFTFSQIQASSDLLCQLAHKCGFHTNGEMNIFRFAPGRMKAMRFGKADLPPLLALSIASGTEDSNHPINRVSREDPDWLLMLQEMKALRDQVNHGEQLTDEDIIKYANRVKASINLLLGFSLEADSEEDEEKELENSYEQKRLQAVINLEQAIPIYDFQELAIHIQSLLIGTQMYINDINLDAVSVNCDKIINDLCSVLQQLIQMHTKRDSIPPNHKVLMLKSAMQAGFALNGQQLPESLLNVRRENIANACSGDKSTIGAYLLAYLLLTPIAQLQQTAQVLPDLILYVAEMVDLRGHANRSVYLPRDKILTLYQQALRTVQFFCEV